MMYQFIAKFISVLFDLIVFAIIARVLLSWFPSRGPSRITEILRDVTDPILLPFKRIVPQIGMIDISPIVAIIAIDLIKSILLNLVFGLTM